MSTLPALIPDKIKEGEVVIFSPYLPESVKIVQSSQFELEMEKTALEFGVRAVGLMVLHGYKWKDIKKTVGSGQFLMACAIKDNKKYAYFCYYFNGYFALRDATDVGKTIGEKLDRISSYFPTNFASDPEWQRVYTVEEHIEKIKSQISEFEWSNHFKPSRKTDNPHDYF